jgi:hypothetical protein
VSRLIVLIVSLVVPAALAVEEEAEQPPPSQPTVAELGWLEGHWQGESNGVAMEEIWTSPEGGLIVGLHRDVFPSGRAFFEFLRIASTDEGIAFLASPMGRDATAFALVSLVDQQAVFENPEHDFPQRIIYERVGDRLRARIEGEQDGRSTSSEWVWQRASAE